MHFGLRMCLEDVAQRSDLSSAIISLLHLSQINHLPQNLCTAPHQDRTLAIYPSTNHHQRYVHLYFTSIAYNSPGMFWFLCFFLALLVAVAHLPSMLNHHPYISQKSAIIIFSHLQLMSFIHHFYPLFYSFSQSYLFILDALNICSNLPFLSYPSFAC